jgi:hypothetical protein
VSDFDKYSLDINVAGFALFLLLATCTLESSTHGRFTLLTSIDIKMPPYIYSFNMGSRGNEFDLTIKVRICELHSTSWSCTPVNKKRPKMLNSAGAYQYEIYSR